MVRDDEMFLGPPAGSYNPQSPESGNTSASTYTYSDMPEVAPEPPMDYYGRDKLDASQAPKAEGPIPVGAEKKPATVCGLKKKIFFIVLAVAIVVVVGAVAGGVAGGLTANNGGSGSDSGQEDATGSDGSGDSSDDDGATKTTAGSPKPTGPIEPEDRAMAASSSSESNIQLFYQDLDTTDILYRRIQDDEAADEQTLELDIEPEFGTPIAAASLNDSDPISTHVFYMGWEEGERQVVQASLECDLDGDSCSTKSNAIISTNITNTVHHESRLAALYLRDDFIRVYYQAGGGHIWVLTNDGGKEWDSTHIARDGYPGTGIVATAPDEDDIHLFFVSDESERLRFMVYSDILGAEDDRSIDDSPGTSWSPDASITGVYVPESDPYRIYYAPPDDGPIVSFWQGADNENKWYRNHNRTWGQVEGGFASAAWQDQVRLYYFQDGELVMSAQDDTTWAELVPL